tara:strand:+ start:171 stop:482 length:312 start_codon:yes stop_codon:yes gene_type:complete
MGQLGFNVVELYDMTPCMFYNAQKGLFEKWETESQNEWERTRWLACILLNPHVKKNIQPKDITRFPWEVAKNKKSEKDIEKIRSEAILFKKINEKKMKQNGKE